MALGASRNLSELPSSWPATVCLIPRQSLLAGQSHLCPTCAVNRSILIKLVIRLHSSLEIGPCNLQGEASSTDPFITIYKKSKCAQLAQTVHRVIPSGPVRTPKVAAGGAGGATPYAGVDVIRPRALRPSDHRCQVFEHIYMM